MHATYVLENKLRINTYSLNVVVKLHRLVKPAMTKFAAARTFRVLQKLLIQPVETIERALFVLLVQKRLLDRLQRRVEDFEVLENKLPPAVPSIVPTTYCDAEASRVFPFFRF